MNKKVVAIIVIVLAAGAIWYGYGKMKPYLASPPPETPAGAAEEGATAI